MIVYCDIDAAEVAKKQGCMGFIPSELADTSPRKITAFFPNAVATRKA